MTRHCLTCPTPVKGLEKFCPVCRAQRRESAWRKQGAQSRSAYQEIDVDRIARVVGRPEPRYELTDHDLHLFDAALTRYLR